MAERREDWDARQHREDTVHPDNPPNSVLSRPARRAALVSYLGPIIVLFLIVGFGLMYWSARDANKPVRHDVDRDQAVGTAGNTTPGGFEPQSRPSSTRDELERRGGIDDPAQGPMPALHDRSALTSIGDVTKKPNDVVGRPVDVKDATVDSANGSSFWIRDGSDKVEVVAGEGMVAPKKGAHVHVVGTVEAAGNAARIRASKVETR